MESLLEDLIAKYSKLEQFEQANNNTDKALEYGRIACGLKECLQLRDERKKLIARLDTAVEETREAREKAESVAKTSNERLIRAHGILEGVKAMLQVPHGTTHRQRDFYEAAIVKMIDNTKHDIKPVKFDEEDLPF